MKRHVFFTVLAASALTIAGAVVSCASDDTIVTGDDAGVDGGTAVDGGSDARGTPETRSDLDAGFKPDSAQQTFAEAFCRRVASCCFGDEQLDGGAPAPDGGTYNQERCLNVYKASGFEDSNPGASASPDRLQLNQGSAAECLNLASKLHCNAVPVGEFQAVRAACYGALVGKQPVGQPCTVTGECAPGAFCNKPDGGSCEAVRDAGAPCGDFTDDPAYAQHGCSYRFSGAPPRFCESYDFTASESLPSASWKCVDALANGAKCANSAWCREGICDPETLTCASSVDLFPPTFCDSFRTP